MSPGDLAERRIASLGIDDVSLLDVEVIAWDAGVRVDYDDLDGCDATLTGFEDRAIATIRRTVRGRERFSIAHELGHWEMHRGQSFRCRVDDLTENLLPSREKERHADSYAAHLLMPAPLFNPVIKSLRLPGFHQLDDVAKQFDVTPLATAVRLVDVNTLPVLLVCYRGPKLRWHSRARDIPNRWWLNDTLDEDTFAYELFKTGTMQRTPRKQSADAWFKNHDAENFEVLEHAKPLHGGDILVLLYMTDSEMLDAQFDPGARHKRR